MLKKVIALFVAFSLFTAITAEALENKESWYYSTEELVFSKSFSFYEDFDSYDLDYNLGAEGKWLKSIKTNTYVRLADDENGKVLKIGAEKDCGNVDAFINPYAIGMSGTFFISFDLKAEIIKNGNLYLSLRNADVNTSNSYDMFHLTNDGQIEYFGSNVDKDGVSSKITSSLQLQEMKTIGFLCNTVEKTIAVYENGKKIGSISDYDLVQNEKKAPNFGNFYARFYMSSNGEYSVALDNIRITELTETVDGVLLNQRIVSNDRLEGTKAAEIYETFVNNTAKEINVDVFTALYNGQKIERVEVEPYTLKKDEVFFGKRETELIYKDNIDKVKMFLFEKDTLTPLARSVEAEEVYADSMMIEDGVVDELFEKSQKKNIHPRLMVTDETLTEIKNDAELKSEREAIIAKADKEVENGTVSIDYNIVDGRLLAVSRRVKERVTTLALAYNLTNDEKYLEAAWLVMEKACSFKDWNTAHLIDTAEMCCAIAFGYDWLYDSLSNYRRNLLEKAMWEKALSYAYNCYVNGNESWMSDTTNRNIVNNGSFIIGALALLDKDEYAEKCEKIIQNAIYYIQFMNETLEPDGAWAEGVGYLEYALEYLAETCSSLETALNTEFSITKQQCIAGINPFLMYSSGIAGRNNFHDDSSYQVSVSPEMLYLAKATNRPSEAEYYIKMRNRLKNEVEIGDLIWKSSSGISNEMPLDGYFRGTEFVAMRDTWNDDAKTYLSFHGGTNDNGEGHYHIDAGSFVLDLNGVRWAEDLGTDYITYSYGTGKRQSIYRVRAEGHNTLVINPQESTLKETQDGGQAADTDAKVIDFGTLSDGTFATLDLSSAYPDSCTKVTRKFSLTDNRTSAIIEDNIELKDTSEIYWFMHMKAPDNVTKNEDGSITIIREGKKINVSVSYMAENGNADVSIVEAKKLSSSPSTPQLDEENVLEEANNDDYRKLQIKITNAPKGNNRIVVKLKPEN